MRDKFADSVFFQSRLSVVSCVGGQREARGWVGGGVGGRGVGVEVVGWVCGCGPG